MYWNKKWFYPILKVELHNTLDCKSVNHFKKEHHQTWAGKP